ncbi:head-tail connector protein [Aquabacter cavernae]|uniref:head-tail connector protein n=1 Tax=Aquabacter cavernae TaxID=2496029 RepID=UPI000F8CB299|nr:head-tail connector protein [Aquabacter cavernae]
MSDSLNATDVVSLDDLKRHLRVDGSYEDSTLEQMLEAALRHVEAWVGPLATFEGEVPDDIGMAMKVLVGHWFTEGREAALPEPLLEIPFGFRELITPYRKWEF